MPPSPPSPNLHAAWRWDLFCRVVDNYGDLGVCHRAAQHLAALGQCVRLWVDDAALMGHMSPNTPQATEAFWATGAAGVAWVHWTPVIGESLEPGDVVVEAFGCDPPPRFVERMAASARPPVWINLEYLSAEDYVPRSHGLASPQSAGPGRGLTKWFYYPGFTDNTGGLLREPGLLDRRAAFDQRAWLQGLGLPATGERRLGLFAYDSAPLEALLHSLAAVAEPTRLLVAHGPLQARAQAWLKQHGDAAGHLRFTALPWLSTDDFDHLLWSTDLNFVRGEDSLVRGLWADAPLVWHIYPQHDGVHAHKLQAFWNWLSAPGAGHGSPDRLDSLWPWWAAWNALAPWPAQEPWPWDDLPGWNRGFGKARAALVHQRPLAPALLEFVAGKRATG